MADQFYHRYEYDAENRLTDVYTTDRKQLLAVPGLEEHEARYSYYKHGPLAKAIIGQQQVQGIDYAYTLQGWLKGVNSDSLLDEDGTVSSVVAKDAYRFSLNYFNTDYTAIGASVQQVFPGHSGHMQTVSMGDYRPLYNGNISSMVVGIPKVGETRLYNYKYDQLNRLVRMDSWKGYNTGTHNWAGMVKTEEYKERISYDGNGNIKTYLRNGNTAQLAMDNMTYGYNKENDTLINNRLRHVKDAIGDGNYTVDIDNQGDDNYEYDGIGNLIKDTKEGITAIDWTVYGKIRKITKSDGTVIRFTYDVSGNRIGKAVTVSGNTTTNWYARDIQGNPMGIYLGIGNSLKLTEQSLYGNSRLGVWNRSIVMNEPVDVKNYIFGKGEKFFELSNHLGNVLATVSDKKFGHDGGSGVIDYYNADITSASDYYPFGMQMIGRKFDAGRYRYGFQGQEKDNEVKGEGNSINFNMRVYDPRIGKFLSLDPISDQYPFYSPYHFSSNQPIHASEIDGLESEFDLNLPSSPYNIDEAHWKFDASHKDPNSYRWKDVSGNSLYWTQGQKGKDGKPLDGWEGRDHYHFEDERGRRYNAAGNLAKSRKSGEAHLTPGTQTSIKIKASVATTEVNGLASTTTKTTPTPKTVTQKINGTMKSVFLVADIASTVTGIITGDPDALVNQFGGARVGQLKSGTLDPFEMGFGGTTIRRYSNYYMITKEVVKEWSENGAKYKTITRYVQHYESKQKVNGRYVGHGEVGPTFDQTQTYKDGKLIDMGRLHNPESIL